MNRIFLETKLYVKKRDFEWCYMRIFAWELDLILDNTNVSFFIIIVIIIIIIIISSSSSISENGFQGVQKLNFGVK